MLDRKEERIKLITPKITDDKEHIVFSDIYTSAKTRRVDKLIKWIQDGYIDTFGICSGYCLGFLFQGCNPITLLAAEGEISTVDFLMNTFGAHINPNLPAFGFALVGNVNEVNKLFKQGANSSNVVKYYAMGGWTFEVDDLIQKGASIFKAIIGYGLVGNDIEVEKLLKILTPDNLNEGLNCALFAYGCAGIEITCPKIQALIAKGAHPKHLIRGHAYGGHFDKLTPLLQGQLLQGNGDNIIIQERINSAIEGAYSAGFPSPEIDLMLLNEGGDRYRAIISLGQSGNLPKIRKLLHDTPVQQLKTMIKGAIEGLAYAGNIPCVDWLSKGFGERTLIAFNAYKTWKYLSTEAGIHRILTFTSNDDLKNLIAAHAKTLNVSFEGNPVFLANATLARINDPRFYLKLNYVQAKAVSTSGIKAFLLQGSSVLEGSKKGPKTIPALPHDIFWDFISLFLLKLSKPESQYVYLAFHEWLKSERRKAASDLWFDEKRQAAIRRANEQYNERTSCILFGKPLRKLIKAGKAHKNESELEIKTLFLRNG
jgi:hypothetical protein